MWKQTLIASCIGLGLIGCGTDGTSGRISVSSIAPSGTVPSGQCYDNVEDCSGRPSHHVVFGWGNKDCVAWLAQAPSGSSCVVQPVNIDLKAMSAGYIVFDNDYVRGVKRCADVLKHEAVDTSTCRVISERTAVG